MTKDKWEEFEVLLKSQDWHCGMSDDHGVYLAGRRSFMYLCHTRDELLREDKQRTLQLWNKYKPDQVHM